MTVANYASTIIHWQLYLRIVKSVRSTRQLLAYWPCLDLIPANRSSQSSIVLFHRSVSHRDMENLKENARLGISVERVTPSPAIIDSVATPSLRGTQTAVIL